MKPSLKMRVLTAAVGVPVIVLILLAPTWVMLCTVILCSLIGIYEFYDAVNMKKEVPLLCLFGFLGTVILPLCAFLLPKQILTCAYGYLVILFLAMLGSNRKIMITDVAMLIISLIYIPFMLSHLLFIRRLDFGNILVWLVFLGAFMTDSCAFFAGKLFGKHKLCPNISPKKTIEGAVGGVIVCGLGFLLFAFIINTFISAYIGGAEMSYMLMFILGVIASFVAQIGDLTASLIKRQFGIKDFGKMFPGHGGMLDRCDSIIMVAPVVFIFAAQISLFI